jgi:hypothetical protein
MPASFVGLGADSTGKKLRSRERTVDADLIHERRHVLERWHQRVVLFRGTGATFRTVGNATAGAQGLFFFHSTLAATRYVAITQIELMLDATAALTTVTPRAEIQLYTDNPAWPTGAGIVPFVSCDTALTESGTTIMSQAAASDGAQSTIGQPTGGTLVSDRLRSQFPMRMHTTTTTGGQVEMANRTFLIAPGEGPLILRPGVGEGIRVIIAPYGGGTTNPITNHWMANVAFEEFELP